MNSQELEASATAALERKKRIKRIKRRLLPCLLSGFSLPFTLFLYGPYDLFAQNRAELAFSLYDFILPCILLTLGVGLLLAAPPLFLLKKKAYSLYIGILFWASVMLFLQGNYLNFGLSSLAGDGVGSATKTVTVVINTAIWVLTLAAVAVCILLFKPLRKKLRSIVSLGLCIVFVMEAAGAVAVSFGDNIFADKEQILGMENGSMSQKMLTKDNLTALATDKNVVVFIVDRFDARYYRDASEHYPEIFSELEGFTSFGNYTTLYARTFPAVTSILTGVENDFSSTRKEYFEQAYATAPALKYMSEQGYDINIYTDSYYAYDTAASMQEYTKNISSYSDYIISDRAALWGNMLAFSAYRYFPFILKPTVDGVSTESFSSLVEYVAKTDEEKYGVDNREVWNSLNEVDFSISDSDKQLSFIHISGCHTPTKYNAQWQDGEEDKSSVENVMTQSFKIISRYLSEMKRLGVYGNSTVIITGDHAAAMSDRRPVEGARVTAMLVKPSDTSGGEIIENTAPVSQSDLWATVFDCENLTDAPDMGGISFFEVADDASRERRYVFHRMDGDTTEALEYKITGDANVFTNWELVSTTPIHRIYD